MMKKVTSVVFISVTGVLSMLVLGYYLDSIDFPVSNRPAVVNTEGDTIARSSLLQAQGPQNWRNLPTELYQMAPVILDTVPRNFLPQFKNPCWYGTNEQQLFCLPYFYLLGFPKAGTTDIWDKINNHPQISRTAKKEPHFWFDRKIGNAAGFEAYMANAASLNRRLLAGDSESVCGDGSATTIVSHFRVGKHFPNVTADMYTNVDVIREITPRAKMVVAVREPVSRLYSGYLYQPMYQRRTVEGFHREAVNYINAFQNCGKMYSEHKCIYGKNLTDNREQRLKVGFYEPYIRSWVERFGFDQVMMIRLEDWTNNCVGILPKIYEYLGMGTLKLETIYKICDLEATNTNVKGYKAGKMLPHSRLLLEQFYSPYNEKLARYMNVSVYHAKP